MSTKQIYIYLSVCPSVCLSVCPSYLSIVSVDLVNKIILQTPLSSFHVSFFINKYFFYCFENFFNT